MTITELMDIEQTISKMVENIKNDIISELKVAKNPDYQPINSFCGIVKFSTLSKSQNWSPDYYMPEQQAKIVEQQLIHCKTVTTLRSKIQTLIEKGETRVCPWISSSSTYRVQLNPITIKILKKYYQEEQNNA